MTINNKNIALILVLFLALFSKQNYAQDVLALKQLQPIEVQAAYIRETIPGNTISSAYFTLINHTKQAIKLVSVSSDISPRIEIHAHTMTEGMMKMEKIDAISVNANAQVLLQPYGLHLMIFGLKQPLQAGHKIKFTLHFAQHKSIDVTMPVQSLHQK